MTIYEKGAEVVRMLLTLLGEETFRKGTDLYFKDNDGKAVTCDDFVAAMATVSGRDLTLFSRWYSQSGTPELRSTTSYDAKAQTLTLTLTQQTKPTADQPTKQPVLLPIKIALLGEGGRRLPITMQGRALGTETVLEFGVAEQSFVFEGVREPPVLSLLRDFSAPVKLTTDDDERALLFRLAHDDDAFNRAEAGQELFLRHLENSVQKLQSKEPALPPSQALLAAMDTALQGALRGDADPSLLALALAPPGIDVVGDRLPWADYASAHTAREHLMTAIATSLSSTLTAVAAKATASLGDGAYEFSPLAVGWRRLRNLAVAVLSRIDGALVERHLQHAKDMTDTQVALGLLAQTEGAARDAAFAAFFDTWQGEALVIDKWFALQAQSTRKTALDDVAKLLTHKDFSMENPNRVRAVVGAFASGNPLHFHDASGRGYALLGERVRMLDAFNPQIAARMLTPLTRWKRQDAPRQALMRRELEVVLQRDGVSPDVREIATKALS
jgi:aminopeptidase N